MQDFCFKEQLNGEIHSLVQDLEERILVLGRPLFTVELVPRLLLQGQKEQTAIANCCYSRKERSLEELTKKFITEFQGKKKILELQHVTKELQIERRRVYDVINIFESLGVVRKCCKSKYCWLGLNKAIDVIKDYELGNHSKYEIPLTSRGQRSLQCLSKGFLRLFLFAQTPITLESAAKKLIPSKDNHIVRTKVRRLYDIVNVFKALGCVRKVTYNRKPAFQWAGLTKIKKIIKEHNREESMTVNNFPSGTDDLEPEIMREEESLHPQTEQENPNLAEQLTLQQKLTIPTQQCLTQFSSINSTLQQYFSVDKTLNIMFPQRTNTFRLLIPTVIYPYENKW